MKKALSLFLTFVMTAALLVACGGDDPVVEKVKDNGSSAKQLGELSASDFGVYVNGTAVVYAHEFDYGEFDFIEDAYYYDLDEDALETWRGIGLGASVDDIAFAYSGVSCIVVDSDEIDDFDEMTMFTGAKEDLEATLRTKTPGYEFAVVYMIISMNGESISFEDLMVAALTMDEDDIDDLSMYMLAFHIVNGKVNNVAIMHESDTF